MTTKIFVTVGTTLFDDLIDAVTDAEMLKQFISTGCTHLIIQYGKGQQPLIPNHIDKESSATNSSKFQQGETTRNEGSTSSFTCGGIVLLIEMYRFKSSLLHDMESSNVIITHAGAGTITEALRIQQQQRDGGNSSKTLVTVAVINTKLMNNHQTELAYALQKRQYLYVLEQPSPDLYSYWGNDTTAAKTIQNFQPEAYPKGDPHNIPNIIDSFTGL